MKGWRKKGIIALLVGLTLVWGIRHTWGDSTWFSGLVIGVPEPVWTGLTFLVFLITLSPRHRQFWFMAGLGILLNLAILNPVLQLEREPGTGDLKVMQLNMQHGVAGSDKVALLIERENPDILFLQETGPLDQEPGLIPPSLIRTLRPYRVVRKQFEAIAVRGDVLSSEFIPLQDMPGEEKIATVAVVRVQGRKFRCICVHLSPSQPNRVAPSEVLSYMNAIGKVHQVQVQMLVDLVSASDEPVLLAGDFNQYPAGPWYRQVASVAQDSHRQAGSGFGFTMSATIPVQRYDYIWARTLTATAVRVRPDVVSDHRAVVAWFR